MVWIISSQAKGEDKMEWRVIRYNKQYEISDTGLVRNIRSGDILSNGKIRKGRKIVKLKNRKFYVDRLVAEHFIPNPDPQKTTVIAHKDENNLNNHVDNLEWVSRRELSAREYKKVRERIKEKKRLANIPIPVIQYDLDHNEIARFPSVSRAHKATEIRVVDIMKCLRGEVATAGGFIWEEGSTTKKERNS